MAKTSISEAKWTRSARGPRSLTHIASHSSLVCEHSSEDGSSKQDVQSDMMR